MVAQPADPGLQLILTPKLLCRRHFPVKEDLKASFIDRATHLKHIRLRRPGSSRGVRGDLDEAFTSRGVAIAAITWIP